jgi:hypothetical protein
MSPITAALTGCEIALIQPFGLLDWGLEKHVDRAGGGAVDISSARMLRAVRFPVSFPA